MALFHSPSIVKDSVILHYDAANIKSYSYQENLITYSNNFATTGSWVIQAAVTITPSAAYAPDGTLTASSYFLNAPSGRGVQYYPTLIAGQTYTFSIFVKPIVDTTVLLRINTTSTAIDSNTSVTASAGWTRLSSTFVPDASFQSVQFQDISGNTGTLFYCWGSQLQRSQTLNPYVPTTGSTITPTTSFVDLSNSKINGTLTNNPSYVSSSSGVLNFTSSTASYVNIPYNSAHEFLGLSPFTFELWIKPTEDPGINQYRRLVGHENFGATRNGYTLYVNNGSAGIYTLAAERWVLSNSISPVNFSVASLSILGKWNHIVYTFDGAFNYLYRNGTIASGPSAVSSTATLITTSVPLSLAAYYGTGSFSGDIGLFRVYSKGLTAAEVQQNFQAQRDRYGV
jgi:hypothetical protein